MIDIRYVLLLRDGHDSKIAVIGTGREPLTKQGKPTPNIHTFICSTFALYPAASSIEAVSWRAGMDVEREPALFTARRTDQARILAYRFPDKEVEACK